jgi:phospholipid transport system substrate-binding protein
MRGAAGLLAILLTVLTGGPLRAAEAEREAAVAVARTLLMATHGAMAAEGLGEAERFTRVKQAVAEAFAFDIWERFLVGDRELTEAERETFRALLPGFLARLYADQFAKGLAGEPEILGAREVRRDVLVEARMPRAAAPPLPVDYRLRAIEGRGPQVIDVMVGGVSFLLLKRDEFKALIEKDGVEGLLSFMRAHGG